MNIDKLRRTSFNLVLLLIVLIPISSQAQFRDWSTKFGIRGSILLPENEFANLGFAGNDDLSFDWYKFSYLTELFLGIRASRVSELQLTLGYGEYSGKAYFDNTTTSFGEYKTAIIPVNLRFRFSPWEMTDWNPYFYFGGGLMSYDLITNPSDNVGGKSIKDAGWSGIFPIGIGTEYALSENILLDFSINSGISTTFDLEGYDSGGNQIWDSYFNIGIGLTLVSKSCSEDKDADGLGQCDEELFGTDPLNPDTDNDGLTDGDEVSNHKTDPLKNDSDDDSLSDNDELTTYLTNPLVYDTDNDSLSDGEEVLNFKTDPLKVDSDSDDLTDGDEVLNYKTNPLRADTDGDGLSDGGEILNYKTDPNKVDTDGEGLSDSDEIIKYKTNPNYADTDSGSIDDFTEVRRGTNPLNAEDDIVEEEPVKINVPIVLEGITFAKNKADITPESEIVLQGALNTMQTYGDIVVEISGHTDSDGSIEVNQILSQKRAESVRLWLINNGISPERIIAKGYGEDFPRVPNDSSANKKLNRRIEFKRIK